MNQRQKVHVQLSFTKLSAQTEQASEIFFKHLFKLAPELRDGFATVDTGEEGRKFFQALGFAIRYLDEDAEPVAQIEEVVRRWSGYGFHPRHCEQAGEALLAAVEDFVGADFRGEVGEAWRVATERLVGTFERVLTGADDAPVGQSSATGDSGS